MRDKSQKELVCKLRNEGLSFSKISQYLGISRHSVRSLYVYKPVIHHHKRGPKWKLTKKDVLTIKREISKLKENKEKINSPKIKRNCILPVSRRTVQRYIGRLGMKYKKSKCQIILSKKHKLERVRIITDWISRNHSWEKTIFSDEKCFYMDGPDDWKTFVDKSSNHIREKRQCKGGKIMVWLMVQPNGLLAFKIINGKFNSSEYIKLLSEKMVPLMKLNFGEDFYFQQDNAAIHKSHTVQKFLRDSQMRVIEWPAKSPDLNIVEDIWKTMSDIIYDGAQFQSKMDLAQSIKNVVFQINSERKSYICDLYARIRPHLCKVLQKKGDLYNKCF